MTYRTAAEYLDTSAETIERLARDGKLSKHTIAGKDRLPRVDKLELDHLIEDGEDFGDEAT